MAIFLPNLSLFHASIMLLTFGLVQASILAFMCIGIDTDSYPDTDILDNEFFKQTVLQAHQNLLGHKRRIHRRLMLGRLYLFLLVVSLLEGCTGLILLGQTFFIPTIVLFSGVLATGIIIFLIFRSLFYRPDFPESPDVLIAAADNFPNLNELVRNTQQKVQAPTLHHIYIVPGNNCAVQLYSDFFGLRKKNIMEIGIDLLMYLDDEELEALLAHELAHIRKKDTLLGYRLTISMIRWCIVGENANSREYAVRMLLAKFAEYQSLSLKFLMDAIRKPQEVEADSLAADVAGTDPCIRLHLKGIAMHQIPDFQIDLFEITDPEQLPAKPYTQSLKSIEDYGLSNGSQDGFVHLDIEEKLSGMTDTHPSVYERLQTLGWRGKPSEIALVPKNNLDPGFAPAVAFFDENWSASMVQDWEDFFESSEDDDEIIKEYDGSMEDGDICMAYGWALFRRRRWQEALDHFSKVAEIFDDPDDIVAHAIVTCRLRLGDETALNELIRLTDAHPNLIEDTFDEIGIFIKNTGNEDLWQKMDEWLNEKAQIHKEYKRELGPLRGRDALIGASIPNNRILAPLREELYKLRRIKSIILMRKDVQYADKGPLIVGIDVGFGTTTAKDIQKVTDIFEDYMHELPYEGLIVMTYEQNPRFFLREFLGSKGNMVYNRWLYSRGLKKNAGLSEEELASKQREQRNHYKSKLRRPVQENDLAEVETDDPDDMQD
jgi:Zn-dependent protease with chaperone function